MPFKSEVNKGHHEEQKISQSGDRCGIVRPRQGPAPYMELHKSTWVTPGQADRGSVPGLLFLLVVFTPLLSVCTPRHVLLS
jgi:hypothetical protein